VPKDLPADQVKYVLGVQGNMWGEQTQTLESVDRRTFPRLTALAETGWTCRDGRNFEDFSRRLALLCKRLDLLEVNYRKTE
jgi:hexosaminidase